MNDRLDERPSWALRLRQRIQSSCLGLLERSSRLKPRTDKPAINASGKWHDVRTNLTYTRTELALKGVPQGIIRNCSAAFGMELFASQATNVGETMISEPLISETVHMASFVLESYSALGQHHWTGRTTDEIIAQTTNFYGCGIDEAAIEEDLSEMRSGLLRLLMNMFIFWAIDMPRDQILALLGSLPPSRGIPTLWELMDAKAKCEQIDPNAALKTHVDKGAAWQDINSRISEGRRLFYTDTEFGYGPAAMLPGDVVWVLIPSRVPHILRPSGQDGRYYLIGDAYAHGIMCGEAMDRADESDIRDVVLI